MTSTGPQLDALREVFQTHGIPATQEMMDLYIRINNHLWGQFDRGEITTEELTRVRFRLFLEEAGDQGQDPAAMNRQYLESLGSHSYLLDGAEALCRELAPYCKQYIVTNGIKVAQVGRLNTSPIRPYIEKMYISGEMGIPQARGRFFPDRLRRPGDDAGAVEADGDCGRRPGLGHFGRAQRPRGHHLVQPGGKGKSDRYYPHLGGGGLPGGPEDHPGGSVGENWTRIQAFSQAVFRRNDERMGKHHCQPAELKYNNKKVMRLTDRVV